MDDNIEHDEMCGHVARKGEMTTQTILLNDPKGKRPLARVGADRMIILQWMSEKQVVRMWTELIGYG
jgi:hypothetical protein